MAHNYESDCTPSTSRSDTPLRPPPPPSESSWEILNSKLDESMTIREEEEEEEEEDEEEEEEEEEEPRFLKEKKLELAARNALEKSELEEERKREEKAKRESELRRLKAIKATPPGLNVFTEPAFRYFDFDSLDLERDFAFKGRKRLTKVSGLSNPDFDRILKDPLGFVTYLNPESSSLMITDSKDFQSVCNYLFYSSSVCCDPEIHEVYSKALFSLLKNYAFHWSLKLIDVLAILLNFGGNEKAIKDEAFLKTMLENRIEAIQLKCKIRNEQQKQVEILPSTFPSFFKLRDSAKISEEQKYECIKRFIQLLAELCSVKHLIKEAIIYKNENWIPLLILIYLIALVGSDRHFIPDGSVRKNLDLFFHYILESFSSKEFSTNGEFFGAESDIAEVLYQVGMQLDNDSIKTWTKENLPNLVNFLTMDHHANMVYRLGFLPPTLRGNRVRKLLAYMYLQTVLNVPVIDSGGVVDIRMVVKIVQNEKGRFQVLSQEYYVMQSLVHFIDAIAGNEPTLDYRKENHEALKIVSKFLQRYRQSLKENIRDNSPSYLKEIINQVLHKWELFMWQKDTTNSITNFLTQ